MNKLTENELDGIASRYQSGRPDDILKLIDHSAAQEAEIERLREAVKDAAIICRFQRKTAAHEAQNVEKAQAAWTRWVEKFEALAQGLESKELENAGDWNWHRTCRKCGSLFRKIDGMWVGNHRSKCEFAKAKGGR